MNLIFPKLRNRITILFVFVLLIPALWYNLGLMGFNDDEAIRALVALEMDLSGNYLVPTINGDFYFAKPPLFNWILSITCKIIGGYTEFNTRTISLIFLIVFCVLIYHFSKQFFTKRYALINALLYLTCGRVLFWDSMLGYIDFAYSMVTFLSFMLIYHFHVKKDYLWLFLSSYLLMSIGYLLKGFPSFVFQGLTLIALFSFFDRWKNALSWKHLAGVFVATMVIGGYYLSYYRYVSFDSSLDTLLYQSTQRTVIVKGISDTLKFIVEFPFRYIYHFLPWSIMIILVFRVKMMTRLMNHPFLKYCWFVFLFNIPVYWLSPGTIPRYVLMLMPLLFTVLLALYQMHREQKTLEIKIIDSCFLIAIIGGIIFSFYPMINSRFDDYAFRYVQCPALIISMSYLAYRYVIRPANRLLTFILCILILRLGFNIFYMPEKVKESPLNQCKQEALQIAKSYSENDLSVFDETLMGNLASFYLTNQRQKILPEADENDLQKGILIIGEKEITKLNSPSVIDSFSVCEDPPKMYLVEFDQ